MTIDNEREGRPILSRSEAGQTIESWMLPLSALDKWIRKIMREPHPGVQSAATESEAKVNEPSPNQSPIG